MKKILALVLCVLMAATALVGCPAPAPETPGTPDAVKFGAGVYTSTPTATDATTDKAGSAGIDVTAAAVLVDKDGKIVACAFDTASNTVSYDAAGKAIASGEFKTKYELGDAYNMVAWGGATLEWYAQADAFKTVVIGKTLDEVKALVVEDSNKGTEEVINAGCTIKINEFVAAIEEAYAAATVEVAATATVKVNFASSQSGTDATEEVDGKNKLTVNIFAAAVDAAGKVLAATSDCVEVEFTFDTTGASTFDTTKPVLSKKEKGADYGMVAYGGATKEWFEQAAAFDAACVGKTAAEIAGLQGADGKGIDTLQAAGCTIYVTGFVAAATKH